jgi:hypothetical protein
VQRPDDESARVSAPLQISSALGHVVLCNFDGLVLADLERGAGELRRRSIGELERGDHLPCARCRGASATGRDEQKSDEKRAH